MSMCRVCSCVVGRGCLLWAVCSLGKTLLAFSLPHSVLQGQICLLLQVFLDGLWLSHKKGQNIVKCSNVDLAIIILSEVSQTEKDKYHMISLICGLWNTVQVLLSRFSRVRLFVTPWTVAHQDSLSMGFSRQEYWSGLPLSTLRDLPDPGLEPASHLSPALAGRCFTTEPPVKPGTCFFLIEG